MENLFCNCIAWKKGLDPVGYARPITKLLALEVDLPWRPNTIENLPPSFNQIIQHARKQKGAILRTMGLSNLFLIAPDKNKIENKVRKAIVWKRPSSHFAHFLRHEYLLPDHLMADFGWAVTFHPEKLPEFDQYLIHQEKNARDFLVCTHGSRDAVCGKFGYPLYETLESIAKENNDIQVWRVSHIGGHVFAPTMLELPSGIFWGNLYDDTVNKVAMRSGATLPLRMHYRGWSGTQQGFAQAAEREMFMMKGWGWLDTQRKVTITKQDTATTPRWAEVNINYYEPTGQQRQFTARVETIYHLETIDSTGSLHAHPYPQYKVTNLQNSFCQTYEDHYAI